MAGYIVDTSLGVWLCFWIISFSAMALARTFCCCGVGLYLGGLVWFGLVLYGMLGLYMMEL